MCNMTGNRPKPDTTHLSLLLLQQLQDMKMKLDLKVTVTYKNGKVKVKWISKSVSLICSLWIALELACSGGRYTLSYV